jgi:hypothetical protein
MLVKLFEEMREDVDGESISSHYKIRFDDYLDCLYEGNKLYKETENKITKTRKAQEKHYHQRIKHQMFSLLQEIKYYSYVDIQDTRRLISVNSDCISAVHILLRDKIYINVLDSFSDSDFCCSPNQNINPIPPTPSPPGIYYGKVNNPTINSGDISSLTFLTTPTGVNFYITQPEGNGYGYILVPTTITQPIKFRDSNSGCNGFIIPTNNIDTINLVDTEGFLVTYNIYRTYYKFNGEVDIWLCNT